MSEPKLLFCTLRDGGTEWHLECRFANGEKFVAAWVNIEFEMLAKTLRDVLNQRSLLEQDKVEGKGNE